MSEFVRWVTLKQSSEYAQFNVAVRQNLQISSPRPTGSPRKTVGQIWSAHLRILSQFTNTLFNTLFKWRICCLSTLSISFLSRILNNKLVASLCFRLSENVNTLLKGCAILNESTDTLDTFKVVIEDKAYSCYLNLDCTDPGASNYNIVDEMI